MRVLFGSSGLVGSGIRKAFDQSNLHIECPSHDQVDLLDLDSIMGYLELAKPKSIIMAAGVVGGISFNSANQVSQYSDNLLMNYNLLKACSENKIEKLLLVSSSCIYPGSSEAPIKESSIFDGPPEPTNAGYAAAKLAAINHLLLVRKALKYNWGVCLPTNVIGHEKNFSLDTHVVPSLIRKISQIRAAGGDVLDIWGDGSPVREFIHNMDLGLAIVFLESLTSYPEIVNIGTSETITIDDLVSQIIRLMNLNLQINRDTSKPNGHPNKSLDSTLIRDLGWSPCYTLSTALSDVISKFELAKAIEIVE
jgi:GDP-L-fucose synthase